MVFGTKKLPNIGSDLGGAVKGFRDGMKDGGAADEKAAPSAQVERTDRRRQVHHRRRGPPEVLDVPEPSGVIDLGISKMASSGPWR